MPNFAEQFIQGFSVGEGIKRRQQESARDMELHDYRVRALKHALDSEKLDYEAKELGLQKNKRQIVLESLLNQPVSQPAVARSPGQQFQEPIPQGASEEGPMPPAIQAAPLLQSGQAGGLAQPFQQLEERSWMPGREQVQIPGIAGLVEPSTASALDLQQQFMRQFAQRQAMEEAYKVHNVSPGGQLVRGTGEVVARGGPPLAQDEFERFANDLAAAKGRPLTPEERLKARPLFKTMNQDPEMRAILMSLRNMQTQVAEANATKKGDIEQALDTAAQSIASGDLTSLRHVASLRNENRLVLYDKIKKLNPKFDTASLDRKIKMEELFTTGKEGEQLKSFGTFLEHGGEASDAINAIRQTSSPLINKPLNWLRQKAAGDPSITRLITAIEPVRKEFEGFLLGGRALYADDRKAAEIIINESSSPAQIQAALKQMSRTAKDRVNEANFRYKRVMGKDLLDAFSPEAIEGANKMGVKLFGGSRNFVEVSPGKFEER